MATTTRTIARKSLRPRPRESGDLIPAAPVGVGPAVLILVLNQAIASSVQGHRHRRHGALGYLERTGHFGCAFMPGVQGIVSRRHSVQAKGPVSPRLSVQRRLLYHNQAPHARMHVAV